jgi:hypothetical protein
VAEAADLGARDFQYTVELQSGGRLSMDTFKGSIRLTAWDRDELDIVARIEADPQASQEYAVESVAATEIDVRGSGRSVSIVSDYDRVPARSEGWFGQTQTKILPYVHYEIRAPRELRFELDDHKSTVELDGFKGDFRIDTHKGRVSLQQIEGRIRVDTHKGDVEVDALALDGRSRFETHKGSVRIFLPAAQGVDLRVDAGRRGRVRTHGFQLELTSDPDERDRTYQLRLNGGGPRLELSTYKGEIELTAR